MCLVLSVINGYAFKFCCKCESNIIKLTGHVEIEAMLLSNLRKHYAINVTSVPLWPKGSHSLRLLREILTYYASKAAFLPTMFG